MTKINRFARFSTFTKVAGGVMGAAMLIVGGFFVLSTSRAFAIPPAVTTNPATGVSSVDATLNATNGPTAGTGHSFWVSLASFSTASPSIPAGVYSTPDLGPISGGASFSASLASITTSGVPSNLPAITPNTTYYFVAWSLVGGTWQPGTILNFTTVPPDTTPPAIPTLVAPANGAVVQAAGLVLDWSDETDPSSPVTYQYESSLSSSTGANNAFASVIYGPAPLAVSQIDASGSADNVYFWQVRACDSLNNCSDWSGPWKVVVTHPGSLVIAKTVVPNGAGGSFDFSISGPNGVATGTVSGGGSLPFTNLMPGDYTITETVPGGWDFTSMLCGSTSTTSVANGGTYTVNPSEAATCTITNTERGHVIVTKATDPANDPAQFTITLTNNTSTGSAVEYNTGPLFPPGAVAAYNFNSDTGITTDATGRGNTLTNNNGVTTSAGKIGDAASFVTSTLQTLSIVTSTDLGHSAVDYEEVAWVYLDSNATSSGLFGYGSPNRPKALVSYNASTNLFQVDYRNVSNMSFSATNFGAAQSGKWYFVDFYYSAANATIALGINGVFNTVSSTITGGIGTDPRFWFGFSPATNWYLSGRIDAFAKWKRLLTSQERKDLYQYGLSDTRTITTIAPVDFEVVPGTYNVSEVDQAEWSENATACQNITVGPGETKNCTITNTKLGLITVVKNTLPDTDTSTLFDFTPTGYGAPFQLVNGSSSESDYLPAGRYSVAEAPKDGWDLTGTSCTGGMTPDAITLTPGQHVTCTFTNTERSMVTVLKLAAPNNADRFEITLTGGPDNLSSSTTLTGGGSDAWANIKPGDYTITEKVPDGWTGLQTASCGGESAANIAAGGHPFTLAPGVTLDCIINNTEFGVITGKKFRDKNANGVLDAGDNGVQNWTITATDMSNADAVFTTSTGRGGNYALVNLPPATYTVCEVQQADWTQSFPNLSQNAIVACPGGAGYQVEIFPGQTVTGITFGNWQFAQTQGKKFNDVNGNGVLDRGEPKLAGWTIELYESSNMETPSSTTVTDANGHYVFGNLMPNVSYTVKEVQQSGWTQTYPSDPTSYTMTLSSGQNDNANNFGNFQNAKIAGSKWNDLNGDGSWVEEPTLPNWEIHASRDGFTTKTTLTNADGNYSFDFGPTEAGTWAVSEVPQSGFIQTYPSANSSGTYSVLIESGTGSGSEPTQYNFGNAPQGVLIPTTIAGYKWNDQNADGVRNETEPVIAGWTLALTRMELGESTTTVHVLAVGTTDDSGKASFVISTSTMGAGDYRIFEVDRAGWTNHYPSTVSHPTFTIDDSGNLLNGLTLHENSFFDVTLKDLDGIQHDQDNGENTIQFGNTEDPVVPPPSTGGGGSVSVGGNVAPAGSFGGNNGGGGQVLGAATTTPSTESSLGTSCTVEYITTYLGRGRKNDPAEVKKLQQFLNDNLGTKLPITGFFGNMTFAAVKEFQLKYGNDILAPWVPFGQNPLKPTGFVFKTTKWKINVLMCPAGQISPTMPQLP